MDGETPIWLKEAIELASAGRTDEARDGLAYWMVQDPMAVADLLVAGMRLRPELWENWRETPALADSGATVLARLQAYHARILGVMGLDRMVPPDSAGVALTEPVALESICPAQPKPTAWAEEGVRHLENYLARIVQASKPEASAQAAKTAKALVGLEGFLAGIQAVRQQERNSEVSKVRQVEQNRILVALEDFLDGIRQCRATA